MTQLRRHVRLLPTVARAHAGLTPFSTSRGIHTPHGVYSYGKGYLGSLGMGDFQDVESPTPLASTESLAIRQISAGWAHGGFVTDDGDAYQYGRTHSFRDVLRSTNMNRFFPSLLRIVNGIALKARVDTLIPTILPLPEGEKAKKIVCSAALTYILTESGRLFALGSNSYGQCGNGTDTNTVNMPSEILIGDEDDAVVDIACGYQHGLALTSSGSVFSWGKGERGQLGYGSANVNAPQELLALKNIPMASVHAGFNHSCAITTDGELYVWGKLLNPEGESEKDSDQLVPRLVRTSDAVRLLECSHFHTTFITEDSQLWMLGRTPSGHKATTEEISQVRATAHKFPLAITDNETMEVADVTSIGKGVDKMSFVTRQGQAFEWTMTFGVQPMDALKGRTVSEVESGYDYHLIKAARE